jgi:hypothetical protein
MRPIVTTPLPTPPPVEPPLATFVTLELAVVCGEAAVLELATPATFMGAGFAKADLGNARVSSDVALPAAQSTVPPLTTDQRLPVTRMFVAGYGIRCCGVFGAPKYKRNSTSPPHRGGKACVKNSNGSSPFVACDMGCLGLVNVDAAVS